MLFGGVLIGREAGGICNQGQSAEHAPPPSHRARRVCSNGLCLSSARNGNAVTVARAGPLYSKHTIRANGWGRPRNAPAAARGKEVVCGGAHARRYEHARAPRGCTACERGARLRATPKRGPPNLNARALATQVFPQQPSVRPWPFRLRWRRHCSRPAGRC